MIHFNLSTKKDVIEEHFNLLEKDFKKNINASQLNKAQKKFLIDNLKSIITKQPSDLLLLNKQFKGLVKSKASTVNSQLKKIFNYKNFIVKKEKKYDAYDLAKKLDVRVCLYCNRMYTLTIKIGNKEKQHITRPEFDHFFDQATYPMLALSIYNLIPSCTICNSTLKGSTKFDLSSHIHPYIDNCLSNYKYSFKPYDVKSILGNSSNLEVKVIPGTNPMSTKLTNTADVFKLEAIFNGHTEELRDIFDIRYRFSKTYLDQLFSTYSSLGISYEEAYRIAFGVHYNDTDFGKRPFSKVKKDLLKELEIIR